MSNRDQGPQVQVIPCKPILGAGNVDVILKPTVRVVDTTPVVRPKKPTRRVSGR